MILEKIYFRVLWFVVPFHFWKKARPWLRRKICQMLRTKTLGSPMHIGRKHSAMVQKVWKMSSRTIMSSLEVGKDRFKPVGAKGPKHGWTKNCASCASRCPTRIATVLDMTCCATITSMNCEVKRPHLRTTCSTTKFSGTIFDFGDFFTSGFSHFWSIPRSNSSLRWVSCATFMPFPTHSIWRLYHKFTRLILVCKCLSSGTANISFSFKTTRSMGYKIWKKPRWLCYFESLLLKSRTWCPKKSNWTEFFI